MADMRYVLMKYGFKLVSVPPETRLVEALKRLASLDSGLLLVMADGVLQGVCSAQDALRLSVPAQDDRTLQEVMSAPYCFASPETSVELGLATMLAHGTGQMPILDGAEVLGVVTMGDVVKEVVAQRDTTIRVLKTCLASREEAARLGGMRRGA